MNIIVNLFNIHSTSRGHSIITFLKYKLPRAKKLFIFKLRISKHLSQADITKDLNLMGINMHKNDIGRIEANERTVKDYELYGIAKVLQVSMNELLKGIENNLEK